MSKTVAKNIGYLTLSQAANYILPLVTIPYVTRVVGPENYGLIEFASIAMIYFSAVVVFGFNTTATRKISANPSNIQHVSEVFSRVVVTRFLLLGLTSLVFAILLFTVPAFTGQREMLLFAYPIVFGWALYPDFLFQGIQKLHFVAISNFLVKAIAAMLIFVLIKSPDDFYVVLAINAGAQILVGASLLLLSKKLVPGLTFALVPIQIIWAEIKEGSYVFFSLFFTRIYTFGSVIFLGIMLSDYELGLFAASLKLIIVAQSFLFLPLTGALFPYLSNLFAINFLGYQKAFKRVFALMLGITLISTAVLMIAPEPFVKLVFGMDYLAAAPFLRIMAPMLVAAAISHFCMHQGLIIFHKDKTYLAIIVAVGLVSLGFNYVAIHSFGLAGAAWAKLAIEVILAGFGFLFYSRALKKIKLANKQTP